MDVDTDTFEAASTVFGQRIAAQVTDALTSLTSQLSGLGAMAGSDEAGVTWAASYDQSAQMAVGGMADLGNACFQLAGLLQQTGFNHGAAESASTAGRGGPAQADRTAYSGMSMTCYSLPPSASGGSASPPHGWGLIQHAVGYAWPNGHQDKLHSAASAWNEAATTLNDTAYYTSEAYEAIAGQRSPEVDDAVRVCTAMQSHISELATSCRQIGTGCTDLAGHIDTAHSRIVDELVSLLEWTAGIEVAGGLFAVVTLGASEGAAQVAEAGRIAAAARRIAIVIRSLITAASTVAESVGAVLARVTAVVKRIRPLLGVRASAVVVEEAGALPTVVEVSEQVAVDGLTTAAETSQADDALYQTYVRRKTAEGKVPKGRQAWENLKNSVARNKKVGDEYRDEVVSELGITPGEGGWQTEYTDAAYGRRFDIANPKDQVAIEVKSGSTPTADALTQLSKDETAIADGWQITWQLKTQLNPTLMARLQELAELYPGRFLYTIAGG